MRERIANDLVIKEAEYMLANNATVRQVSAYFRRSKSAVHDDMTKYLPKINKQLASRIAVLFETNTAERALRGGLATKARWERRN